MDPMDGHINSILEMAWTQGNRPRRTRKETDGRRQQASASKSSNDVQRNWVSVLAILRRSRPELTSVVHVGKAANAIVHILPTGL